MLAALSGHEKGATITTTGKDTEGRAVCLMVLQVVDRLSAKTHSLRRCGGF
jgi:hypothetical protein